MSDRSPNSRIGIIAEDLVCVRGGRLVFDEINFTVRPGGALLLHGPNGSGKTSLLRIIAGFLDPVEGSLMWHGRPFGDGEEEADSGLARVAYFGHLDAVKRAMTVTENLTFWADFYGGGIGAIGVAAALDRLGLGHLASLPARFLSAGQRRRLGLARLLAAPAALWLLDEPTVTLDEESVTTIETLIAEHRADGGMVMVATHAGMAIPDAEILTLGATP